VVAAGRAGGSRPWEDKVVLTEVVGRVGVALASWRCPSSDVDL